MIRRPNYFRCRKILADLHKFQDLILHHQRWAGDLELARPLKELIPDLIDNGHAHLLIRKEINKLIPIIRRYLDYAQIETKISVTDRGVFENKNVTKKYHILVNYFELPHSHDSFESVINAVERGIGYYLARKDRAKIEFMNPLHWIAFILRAPILILEFAGVEAGNKIVSRLYAFSLQIFMLLILFFISTKLGLSIPWDKIPWLWTR